MTVSANEVKQALEGGNRLQLQRVYEDAFKEALNIDCPDCISDGRIRLNIYLEQLQREESDINLFVCVYEDKNLKRNEELEFCLWQNKNNPDIKRVIEVTHRPTFNEMFALTKSYQDAVNIIANSDIFFDKSLPLCKKIKPNECYALSRWDWNGNGKAVLFNRHDSQDVWIFRGAVKRVDAAFNMGLPGCDNRLAYEIKKVGYVIRNPSISIHALHYHSSGVRNFSWNDPRQVVPRPYQMVQPCVL